MYTVCYTNRDGIDTYERLDSRQEVADLLIREGLQDSDEDVLIFSPEADDEALSIEDIFAGI